MENEYDRWNRLQQELDNKKVNFYCNIRDVWWCSVGLNIGVELYGKNKLFERPVLILKVYNKEMTLVLPLTSKCCSKYHIPITVGDEISHVVISQGRTVSMKRLSRKVFRISKEDFDRVIKSYINHI